MANEQYISKKTVAASYRPRSSLMSPGLQRARAPFRLQNAITGLILAGFGVGVWAYSISAVKQDDFSDVDEEARALMRVGPTTVEEVKVPVMDEAKVVATQTPSSVSVEVKAATVPSIHRGLLVPILERHFPRLLDPSRKTLIWGAPPVDNIGRLRDSV
jgi:cytochrome c oxidase assembly factor 3